MGSKSKQPKDTVLNANVDSSINQLKTKTPLEIAQELHTQKILNWRDRAGEYANTPRDIMQLPGIEDTVDIYGSAQRNAQAEQHGNPGLAFSNTANTGYGSQIKAQQQMDMAQNTAAAVDNARQNILGNADAQAGNLMNFDFNRNQAVVGAQMGNRSAIWNRPIKPGFWNSFKTGLGSGLANAASSWLSPGGFGAGAGGGQTPPH